MTIDKQRLALIIVVISLFIGVIFFPIQSRNGSRTDPITATEIRVLQPSEDSVKVEPESKTEIIANANSPTGPGSKLTEKDKQKLEIEEVEREYKYYFRETVPNDPIYPQWYTTLLDSELAWDITTGSPATTVAVIDSGYALGHEDLVDAWKANSGERGNTQAGDYCWNGAPEDKQTNNCDDDQNGYVDDWRGWDFSHNDNSPQTNEHGTGASHGTKVSGFVGGRGNNATGSASLNWQTKIMPLQGLYDEGYGFTSDIVLAIIYAVDNGADVINLSLGGPYPDATMEAAINYAYRNNVIVVAASGNCGDDQSSPGCVGTPAPGGMDYPGRYDRVIAVGATTSSDAKASFSSYGPELDFVAPGSGSFIVPTWTSGNSTSAYSSTAYGTSFASPIVASIVALIKAELPNANYDQVYSILYSSSEKVAGMNSNNYTKKYGFGRVNAYQALQETQNIISANLKNTNAAGFNSNPTIGSSTGHYTTSKLGLNSTNRTYCHGNPGEFCTLTFDKQGSSTTVTFDPYKLNDQGIAAIFWQGNEVGSGIWNLSADIGGSSSNTEIIYIQ